VVAVRLVDAQGGVLWEHQGWPAGAPTSTWPIARRIWYDHHTPSLPVETPPGLYRLELYFTDPDSQAKLPARQMNTGESAGEIVPLTYIQVGSSFVAPAHPLTDKAEFDGQIALIGSNLARQEESAPGTELSITLVWHALKRPAQTYTGFVQLLDAEGQLVAQQDHPLAHNFIPSTLWEPGLTIADEYQIALPAALKAGVYQVIVGIYDAATGMRLPLSVNGVAAGDALPMAGLTITD
jgi:hypothetical protein